MILVTGAAGKTGQAVLQALRGSGEPIRALVFRSEQAEWLDGFGLAEIQTGDMRDPATLSNALHGVRAIYHIPPNVSPDEVRIGTAVMNAAQKAPVERFVFHSVLHPQIEAMPHHWNKLRVEKQLLESGLDFTILQPTAYMQNIFAHWNEITGQGRFPVPHAPEARLSLVDLEDVAQVAAMVLLHPGHAGAIYELAGTFPISQIEIAEVLSQELERPVRADRIPLDKWEEAARARGLGEYQRNALLAMFRYYDQHGLFGNPQVLTWLLGRAPNTLVSVINRVRSEHVPSR